MLNSRLRQVLLLCALVPTLGLAQIQSREPIRIGVSGPFTGGSAPMGLSMLNGVKLAIDEINGIGGINGRRIELIERDDKADNGVGAKIADELTQMKVAATIGIVNTGVGLASIDAYQKAGIPLMIAVSTGTSLTRKYAPPNAPQNFIFRVSPTLDLEARVIIADLKRKGVSNAAILADATAYGEAGLQAFLREAKAGGISVLAQERFNIGDKDMSAQVRRARASNAKSLVVWGIGPEMAAIARNKEAIGWNAPLLGSWTFSMQNFIEPAGRAGEGALTPQTFVQDMGSSAKNSFLLAYKRAYDTDRIASPMSAAQGYDGMHILYLALRQANSTEGLKITQALENLQSRYQGAITSYHKPYSHQDHDAITQNMVLMGVVSDGRVDYAYADDQRRGALLRMKAQN
jgi:branched-chain amino acid transport system substrate-binding protein